MDYTGSQNAAPLCTNNFSEHYVVSTPLLRSHFRLSVFLSVCLSVTRWSCE